MTDDTLSTEEINEALNDMKIWGRAGDRLVTSIEFEDYKQTVFFANMVFSLAEKEFHHPEVNVGYGEVKIDLWSHDADGITQRDIEMARKIEELVSETEWE